MMYRTLCVSTTILVLAMASCDSGNTDTDPDATDTVDDTLADTVEDAIDTIEDTVAETGDPEPEVECATDNDCDDSNPCTTDTCDDGNECVYDTVDVDDDGYIAAMVDGTDCGGMDCDDSDDSVHPGGSTGCAVGDDHNCNGIEDLDDDEDGYDNETCGGDDCDDSDPDVFPGSTLVECDAVDRDCNGFEDRDNDGDGDESEDCSGDDCDDLDATVNSSAAEIDCDGKDTDCDGDLSTVEDFDRDGWPNEACAVGGAEFDCNDSDNAIFPGASEFCNMVDEDCDGTWTDAANADDDGDDVLDEACGGDDCDDTRADTYLFAWEICGDSVDQDCDTLDDETGPWGPTIRVTNDPNSSDDPEIAWTGSEFGVAWVDNRTTEQRLYFARISDVGEKLTSDILLTPDGEGIWALSMQWTGSQFGVVYQDNRHATAEIYMALVTETGALIGSENRITDEVALSRYPALAWTGTDFGVAWSDRRTGVEEIWFARVSDAGFKIGSEAQVSETTSGSSVAPHMTWTGSRFGVVWDDTRGGAADGAYLALLDADGTKLTTDIQITEAGAEVQKPKIFWTGSEFTLSWTDYRSGPYEIYHARIGADGSKLTSDIQITSMSGMAYDNAPAWTGSEWGLFWTDEASGQAQIYFTTIDAVGVKTGSDVRVDVTTGQAYYPSASWTGSVFGAVWQDDSTGGDEILFGLVHTCP